MMSFINASFLWLLLPILAYLYGKKEKQKLSQNLRWMVLILLIMALARPVLFESMHKEKIEAHALVMALDLSVSMNANDIQPTRAKASREIIKTFLEREGQEQIALLGFTINPLLLSPPTTDRALVKLALENMNSEYILTKGTNLRKLFEKIAKFKDEVKKVILFTDGGDEVLDEALITFVQKENIQVFAIAMATYQGASITQKDGTLLQNEEGHIVISKLNDGLETLAKESGGAFVLFDNVANTVKHIETWLKGQKALDEGLERESKQYFELAFIPLSLALVLFFLSATWFSKKLLALLILLGFNLQAEELLTREAWGEGVEKIKPEAKSWGLFDVYYLQRAYSYYDKKAYAQSEKEIYKIKNRTLESQLLLAHSFYKQEKYQVAKSLLKGIKSTDKKIKQQLYYELGNCEAKLLYMERAKNYYVKALQLGEDKDALHNLEIVLFRLNEDSFKVGYTNPSSAEKSNTKQDDLEIEETKEPSKKSESTGGAGGKGNKQSKNSTVTVISSNKEDNAKRVFSSKAYDLINDGYIGENQPW
ncbi:MAG: Unknown protein [uncultured Sulfurovum sp.]|uniref:VWFA domain-containing protein n=1 Tax=uncultured Sulfurovum sp. TaxID=269237 RepID=A0A6S6T2P9_9BACT|nr:MAG: Unknown protein [uncultured Sulfurovum sp.]